MSEHTNEVATQQEVVVETYEFTISGTTYYYSSHPEILTISGHNYTPVFIGRTGISYNSDLTARQCTISVDLVQTILASILTPVVDIVRILVSIDKRFLTDLTVKKNIFKGELKTYSLSDGVLSAVFETITQVIDNDICRVRLQGPCNNTLFDATCGLVALTYRVSATGITKSTDGKTLTSASFGTKPDNYFAGGTLVSGYQERIITSHVGNVITINRAISGLGTTAYVYPGCDKSGNTCVTKFLASNIANFTGMPFIPLNDPETTAITTNQTGV